MASKRRGLHNLTRQIIEFAESRGWTTSFTNGDHIRFDREGCRAVFCAKTPGCDTNLVLMKTKIKRAERAAGIGA